MSIFIGILIVFGLIFLMFLYERNKKLKQISREGGMTRKYSILLDTLLLDPDARIVKLDSDFVMVEYNANAIYWRYQLLQTGSYLTISYFQKTFIGDLKEEWRFPETMNQNLMLEQIRIDIFKIGRNLF